MKMLRNFIISASLLCCSIYAEGQLPARKLKKYAAPILAHQQIGQYVLKTASTIINSPEQEIYRRESSGLICYVGMSDEGILAITKHKKAFKPGIKNITRGVLVKKDATGIVTRQHFGGQLAEDFFSLLEAAFKATGV